MDAIERGITSLLRANKFWGIHVTYMAVLLQEVGSKQNIAAMVRTDRPRSFIIMQVQLVSGSAGSWLKPQSSHCNPKMHGAVLWRSWLIICRYQGEDEKAATSTVLRIRLKKKKQPCPEFWERSCMKLIWGEGYNHFVFHAEAAQLLCFDAVVYHAPEQDELSKTKLHSSAQFLRMPAVEHSDPEPKNRTSSQRRSYVVLHGFMLLFLLKQFNGTRVLEETKISSICILQLHEQFLVQLFAHDHS